MKLFARIVNRWKLLTTFAKLFILDVWLGSGFTSGYRLLHRLLNYYSPVLRFIRNQYLFCLFETQHWAEMSWRGSKLQLFTPKYIGLIFWKCMTERKSHLKVLIYFLLIMLIFSLLWSFPECFRWINKIWPSVTQLWYQNGT